MWIWFAEKLKPLTFEIPSPVCTKRIILFCLKPNSHKLVTVTNGFLDLPNLLGNKTGKAIPSLKLGSWEFHSITNSTLSKGKYAIPPPVNCAEVCVEVFSTGSAQKLFIVQNLPLITPKPSKFVAPILWIVINSLNAEKPLWQDNLLLNANSADLLGSTFQGWKAQSTIKQSGRLDTGTHGLIQHLNH